QREQALRVRRRNRDVDFPDGRFRQTVLEFLPRRAAVACLVDGTARSAADLGPRMELDLPHACEEAVRIVRIDREAAAAGVLVREERSRPGAAAVGGLEDAAFLLRAGRATERAHVNDVRIGRMDAD